MTDTTSMIAVVLLGGPFDHRKIELRREPKRIEIAETIYERIDDPDTGQSLGAYVIASKKEPTR